MSHLLAPTIYPYAHDIPLRPRDINVRRGSDILNTSLPPTLIRPIRTYRPEVMLPYARKAHPRLLTPMPHEGCNAVESLRFHADPSFLSGPVKASTAIAE
jgi:hypothetical protein